MDVSGQVGTLVERTTLFVALVQLSSTKADITAQAFTKILNRFESQMRRSMTYDQGAEMRYHKTLTEDTGSRFPSPTRTLRGSAGSAKTPTACSASTCPKEPIYRCSLRSNSTTSHGGSTPAPGKLWVGKLRQNFSSQKAPSTSSSTGQLKSSLLHLDLESTLPCVGDIGGIKTFGLGRSCY